MVAALVRAQDAMARWIPVLRFDNRSYGEGLAAGVVMGCLALFALRANATVTNPGETNAPLWLNYWSFANTNTWESDRGYAPMSSTNLDACFLGNWTTLVVDNTNAARLQYKVVEDDGTNNLTLNQGSVMFWFAPAWSGTNAGGNGPGQWGRLIEVGQYTTNASCGWWSLYTDAEGVNLYFAAQTNGAEVLYLAMPIAWTTNYWHLIALTYSATNTALYLDGELATNGPGVTVWPGPDVLADGFCIGSDATGVAQARGMFDDFSTYDFPLDTNTIQSAFWFNSISYFLNPENFANLRSAPSAPAYTPEFVAITGAGYLNWVSGNGSGCGVSSNVWFTNVVAFVAANGTMNLTFTIAGGSNDVAYDVFANSILPPAGSRDYPWAWMGRGYHCNTYTLTNLPTNSAFLILGQPTDSDRDGLTDAYEQLVSQTNPANADTDGDGMMDGWEVIQGLDALADDSALTGWRSNFNYDSGGWLTELFGIREKTIGLDAEGNVQQARP